MKAAGALAAVDEVASGMVVGLGTGSTAAHAVREIAARLQTGRLDDVVGVPTSVATEDLARELGIPLVEPGAVPIAAAAARFVVIADDSKLVPALGTTFDIPLEVAKFGIGITNAALQALGRPRLRVTDDAPVATDNGNFIVDLAVDPSGDAIAFDAALHVIPGVLATGLFVGIAAVAYVAGSNGIRRIEAREPA